MKRLWVIFKMMIKFIPKLIKELGDVKKVIDDMVREWYKTFPKNEKVEKDCAWMVESVDTRDLKSLDIVHRAGSTPASGTNENKILKTKPRLRKKPGKAR